MNDNGNMDLIIKRGTVATGSGAAVIDVGIEDGRIVQLGGTMTGSQQIDAEGMFVLPGGVDPHVHLTPPRTGPGENSWADDFEIGTRAALAGGVTTVGNMSFPRKGEQMGEGLRRDIEDGRMNSLTDFFHHPVLLDPDEDALKELPELAVAFLHQPLSAVKRGTLEHVPRAPAVHRRFHDLDGQRNGETRFIGAEMERMLADRGFQQGYLYSGLYTVLMAWCGYEALIRWRGIARRKAYQTWRFVSLISFQVISFLLVNVVAVQALSTQYAWRAWGLCQLLPPLL